MNQKQITERLIEALSKHEVLSDEQRKEWFVKAKNMNEDQIEILIKILDARSHEEFEAQRSQINEKQIELKKHTEELVSQGIKQAYKVAEEELDNEEKSEEERLIELAMN